MKTLKLRIRDKHAKELNEISASVNLVWNYVNELCYTHLKRTGKFFSAYDTQKYTKGSSDLVNLSAQTIQAISEVHATNRKNAKKAKLSWRSNHPHSRAKSLGWIPFKKQAIKQVITRQTGKKGFKSTLHLSLNGRNLIIIDMWDQYNLSQYELNTCQLVQDSQGKWYACISVKNRPKTCCGKSATGIIDNTTSNGEQFRPPNVTKLKEKLVSAQKSNNQARIKAIHAKIRNKKRDAIHKFTTQLVRNNALIVIGDNKPTNQEIPSQESNWFEIKRQLEYKCEYAGCQLEKVDIANTTQDHSEHINTPNGLGMKERLHVGCNTSHDIHVAKNVLAVGLGRLAEESLI